MIQDEERPLFQYLEHGVRQEYRELAGQTPSHHGDHHEDLEGVGRDPQVMPQE